MVSVQVGEDVLAAQINQLLLKPIVRLVAQSTQSIPHNTNTAIQFGSGSEEIDTHNFHDVTTNNTRVTPTISGYYECKGAVAHGADADYTAVNSWIRFSGASNKAPAWRNQPVQLSAITMAHCFATVAIDATAGDYIELMALQTNTSTGANNTNQSSQFSCALEVIYLRPLT